MRSVRYPLIGYYSLFPEGLISLRSCTLARGQMSQTLLRTLVLLGAVKLKVHTTSSSGFVTNKGSRAGLHRPGETACRTLTLAAYRISSLDMSVLVTATGKYLSLSDGYRRLHPSSCCLSGPQAKGIVAPGGDGWETDSFLPKRTAKPHGTACAFSCTRNRVL